LRNRLIVLLAHLLKWQAQPERRGVSWEATIDEQRLSLIEHLEENPSSRPTLSKVMVKAWRRAVLSATRETELARTTFPGECPWSVEQVLDETFYPEN
jgi:hypothetical protein